MITYQFRLRPSKSQAGLINSQLETHRSLYNKCLEKKISAYQNGKEKISCFDLIKSEIPILKGLSNYSSLQQTVRRLDKAYKAFFRKNSKFPRFKSADRFNTIQFAKYGDGCKIRGDKVYVQYVGEIRFQQHREIGKINTVSITRRGNEYYVNVCCELDKPNNCVGNKVIGVDFGIKTTMTTSDGEFVESPYFSKDKHKTIRKLSNKKKYAALQKVHKKIANRRKNFNHHLSKRIVSENDVICLEKLEVESICSFKQVNRKLYDIGINQLINFITYKAENAGKLVVMVNPSYTSQMCHSCGSRQVLTLKEREYNCSCGYSENRDINAAKNILRLGLQSLAIA